MKDGDKGIEETESLKYKLKIFVNLNQIFFFLSLFGFSFAFLRFISFYFVFFRLEKILLLPIELLLLPMELFELVAVISIETTTKTTKPSQHRG